MRLGCCAARCETGTAAARCVWDAALLDENKKKMVQMLKWEGLLDVKKRYSNSDFAARTLILLQDALHLAVTSRSLSAAI